MIREIENIRFKTVNKEWDVYFDMALTMLDEIIKNKAYFQIKLVELEVRLTRRLGWE